MPPSGKVQAVTHYLSLPDNVKRRVRALKKLQFASLEQEAEFFRELHELEARFTTNYLDQLDRRREIVTGNSEPTDEDADWNEESDSGGFAAQLSEMLKQKVTIEEVDESGEPKQADVKGVPDFWLTAMKNVELLAEMIQPHDEPVLKHLSDIRVKLFSGEEHGFELTFHFTPNDWFTNETLTKTYYLRMGPTRDQPWSYEGPEIVRSKGCDIYWRKGKNVTVKLVKKVQKHKSGGQKRTVTKTVETDSFFNFFNPPSQSVDELDENDEDVENILQADFEIGHFMRDRFVPRAVLYFTGDALDDDDDEDFEEEEDEDEDDEEEDDEDGEGQGGRGANAPQQECKQQ